MTEDARRIADLAVTEVATRREREGKIQDKMDEMCSQVGSGECDKKEEFILPSSAASWSRGWKCMTQRNQKREGASEVTIRAS
jgi:hypothetical protein